MSSEPTLESYFGEIWVKCPKCADKAHIRCEPGRGQGFLKNRVSLLQWSNPTFSCHGCGFHETKTFKDWEDHKKWYGPWVGRVETTCDRCGNRIMHRTKPTHQKTSRVELSCQSCNQKNTYELDWVEGCINGQDPYFGLDIYYSKSIKGNLFWVLNHAHCDKLIAYIGDVTRTTSEREKWSMITNLPKWMILSKNRDAVLKALMKIKGSMNS